MHIIYILSSQKVASTFYLNLWNKSVPFTNVSLFNFYYHKKCQYVYVICPSKEFSTNAIHYRTLPTRSSLQQTKTVRPTLTEEGYILYG